MDNDTLRLTAADDRSPCLVNEDHDRRKKEISADNIGRFL